MAGKLRTVVLGCAALFEWLGDKVPLVDHTLDIIAVFVKPLAATLAAASVMTEFDPLIAAVIGLVAGGSLAGGIHFLKAKLRALSTTISATVANPIISLIEDALTLIGAALALIAPLLMMFIVTALVVWALKRTRETA